MESSEKPEASAEESLQPIRALQDNASAFFSSFAQRHGQAMTCARKCSACCHVSLSIFPVEAARILHWVDTLPPEETSTLGDLLKKRVEADLANETTAAPDPTGTLRRPCSMLVDHECAIYPARPIICRTQGALLRWRHPSEETDRSSSPRQPATSGGSEESTDLGAPSFAYDVCPLNFSESAVLPPASEALDLDRLTQLQSIAQGHWERQEAALLYPELKGRERVDLEDLRRMICERCD